MKALTLTLALLIALGARAQSPRTDSTTTWTHTYLKAKPGSRQALRAFVEQNWLVMDAQAVAQRLFKGYQLLENAGADTSYDFVVAVAYFDTSAYAGVAAAFEQIRRQHRKVLIDGRDFPQLGAVIRSSRLIERARHPSQHD